MHGLRLHHGLGKQVRIQRDGEGYQKSYPSLELSLIGAESGDGTQKEMRSRAN